MLDCAIYSAPNGARLLSLSPYAEDIAIRYNRHGYESLSATVPRRMVEALRIARQPILHVAARDNTGYQVFEGRLEDPAIYADDTGSGLRVTAYGYQNAYRDVPYTALWSTTDVTGWRPILTTERTSGDACPDRFDIDTQNRLYLTPKKSATFGTGGVVPTGFLIYEVPSLSARQITNCSFDYTLRCPTNWVAGFARMTASVPFATLGTLWSLTANNTLQTGTQTLSFTGCDAIGFYLYRNAADATHPNEDGADYLRITNLRVTTTATPVEADAIASALVDFVAGVNSGQAATSKQFIQSPNLDLKDEVYGDMYPADILDKLVSLGDDQVPPRLWQWAVWEDRVLRFAPRGDGGRTWYVNAAGLTINRTFSQLANSAYGVYQDASGRTVRTATATDSTSVTLYGLTRRQAVSAQTSNSAQAQVTRDAVVLDGKRLVPQVSITLDALYAATGARVPVYYARPGDTIVVRNIPPQRAEASGVTSFRIEETEYSGGSISVTPESPVPTLETLLARREERV